MHDRIVRLVLNDVEITDSPLLASGEQEAPGGLAHLEHWLKSLSVHELIELTEDFDDEDFHFLQQGVDFNVRLAEYGLKHGRA